MESYLDQPDLDVSSYYRQYIKNKSIDELINEDNRVFGEIKELETEKHYLVTQNYKKFVSATETINYIKSSLISFDSNIRNLKEKIDSIVNNFNVVNSSIEDKLNSANETYKIKKDLKRLKFINDLPDILQSRLDEFNLKKDIKIFEKSLSYYERCKEFLLLHKENPLVKGIYIKTQQLIALYRHLINLEIQPETSENTLQNFEFCLKLLVKIEDDKSDLISTFISIYKNIITKKFEEVFALKENGNEIDFLTYNKIYDNFEFGINENEFLFYEKEIKDIKELCSKDIKLIQFSNLTSNKLKKGTLIWIVKKINESLVTYIQSAYSSYVSLFGYETCSNINEILLLIVSLFYRKINDFILGTPELDPIFFKESLISFYSPLYDVVRTRVNHDEIKLDDTAIHENNLALIQLMIKSIYMKFIDKNTEVLSQALSSNLISGQFNRSNYYSLANQVYKSNSDSIFEYLNLLKNLEIQDLFTSVTSDDIYRIILNLFDINYLIMSHESINSNSSLNEYKQAIKQKFNHHEKTAIFLKICTIKHFIINQKEFSEKVIKTIPFMKNFNKGNEFEKILKLKTNEALISLIESLFTKYDQLIHTKIKEIFFDIDWISYSEPISYRLDIKDVCLTLYTLKNQLESLLTEEKKEYEEKKHGLISDNIYSNNKNRASSRIQMEMKSLVIRKLNIYDHLTIYPQDLLIVLSKVLFKNIIEIIKLKKFSKFGYQQVQLDQYFVKYFLKEFNIFEDQNLLSGFSNEVINIANSQSIEQIVNYDEKIIKSMLEQFKKEFNTSAISEHK